MGAHQMKPHGELGTDRVGEDSPYTIVAIHGVIDNCRVPVDQSCRG